MFHARSDYNSRIQDSENIIPSDEPVFLIRGKDIVGPSAVEAWADLAERVGASTHIVAAARRQANIMREYQTKNKSNVKVPDMNIENLAVDILTNTSRTIMVSCKVCAEVYEYDEHKPDCPNCLSKFCFDNSSLFIVD